MIQSYVPDKIRRGKIIERIEEPCKPRIDGVGKYISE